MGGVVSFYTEPYLMHWAHMIEDTNTLDIDEYNYLFLYSAVRTQYNQRGHSRGSQRGHSRGSQRGSQGEGHEENSVTIIIIINTNINKL